MKRKKNNEMVIEADEVDEVDTAEVSAEIVSEKFHVVKMPEMDEIDKKLELVDKMFDLHDKLIDLSMRHISSSAIIDQGGNPYMTEKAVLPFRAPFGIYEKDVKGFVVKENGVQVEIDSPDAFKGSIKAILYKGVVGSKTLSIEASYEGGVYIDYGNAKFHDKEDYLWFSKKAKANWTGRAIRKLVGLDNMTWEMLAKYGITKSGSASVNYKSSTKSTTPQDVEKENKMRKDITGWILDFYEKEEAPDILQELTSFETKDGKTVRGVTETKKLSGTRLKICHSKIQKWHENEAQKF